MVVDVSTIVNDLFSQTDIDRCQELQLFLHGVRDGRHLLLPEALGMRLNALDEIDAITGGLDPGVLKTYFDPEFITQIKALRSKFEAANEMLYEAARAEIALQGNSPAMDRWLMELANDGSAERPRPGLSFD